MKQQMLRFSINLHQKKKNKFSFTIENLKDCLQRGSAGKSNKNRPQARSICILEGVSSMKLGFQFQVCWTCFLTSHSGAFLHY